MEIVLVVLVIAIMVIVNLVKNRLPDSVKTTTSLIASVALLVWFWGFMEGPIHWKILVSVIVAVSLLMLMLKGRIPSIGKPKEQTLTATQHELSSKINETRTDSAIEKLKSGSSKPCC